LTGILIFVVLKTFMGIIREVKTTFVSLHPVAPGDKSVLFTMPLMNGTLYPMKLGTVSVFLILKVELGVFLNF